LYTDTQSNLEIHLKSDKHKSKLKIQEKLENNSNSNLNKMKKAFSVCEKMNSPLVKTNNNNNNRIIVTPPQAIDTDYLNDLDKIYRESNWCHCCYCEYNSETHKEAHLNGKEHKRKIKIKEQYEAGIYINFCCCYCYVMPLNQTQLDIHYQSNNHFDQIKRYKTYYEANKNSIYVTVIKSIQSSNASSTSLSSINSLEYTSSELSYENLSKYF